MAALSGLTAVLADDPVVVAATSGTARSVAVPEPARALFAATLARATARRPVVMVVPTAVEAERIAGDLREYVGEDAVELFPAWETLPFERVSPATETMGRRLRVIWRLRAGGDHRPQRETMLDGFRLGHRRSLFLRPIEHAVTTSFDRPPAR